MHRVRERVLIVDDDPLMRQLLANTLQGEYQVAVADSGETALEVSASFAPSLVLLDLMLPDVDGLETCRLLRASPQGHDLRVIIVSAKSSKQEHFEGYDAGADDYVVKPIDPHEFLARVRLHFQLHSALAEIAAVRAELDSLRSASNHLSEKQANRLQSIEDTAVLALAKVAECRDDDTGAHVFRIQAYSRILAEQLRRAGPYANQIDDRFMKDLCRSSLLHDIGKVGIADAILLKPGPLAPEELDRMKQHTIIGAAAIGQVAASSPGGSFLAMAAVVARFHHERYDGGGYPTGLHGDEIPLPARIVALADVYDAITSKRPYKPAHPPLVARAEIEAESGRHFDPIIVHAFQESFEEIVEAGRRPEQEIPAPCVDHFQHMNLSLSPV